MKRLVLALLLAATPASAKTILFVGNSFTFGANSAAHYYKPDTVTDLNGPNANGKTVGGVPAFFKAFIKEKQDLITPWSLETVAAGPGLSPGRKNARFSTALDVVVMHVSTWISPSGDSAALVSSAKKCRHVSCEKRERSRPG